MGLGKGLGKGLDSLITDKIGDKSTEGGGKQFVDIAKVEPNKEQPRKHFEEDSILELSESIKKHGILQPLLVQDKGEYYEIISGERRWRAAKKASLSKVPVIILKDLTPQEIVEISLVENLQREDLNPIEEALGYKRLLDEFNYKHDEIAEGVSKSRTAITNSLRLLKLYGNVQEMVIEDKLSMGHARALLGIEEEDKQYAIAQKIFDEKLSVRETEKLIKKMQNQKKEEGRKKEESALDVVYQDIEQNLKNIIGTKVSIHQKDHEKGKIEIEYYSREEFERIVDLFRSMH
ncbi:chromosome partitioning protein ParB [Clostridia bacterium]|nr:chromosome partitioning protein ParB [Clostridia bacterium]